jgi:hypothetical protein
MSVRALAYWAQGGEFQGTFSNTLCKRSRFHVAAIMMCALGWRGAMTIHTACSTVRACMHLAHASEFEAVAHD